MLGFSKIARDIMEAARKRKDMETYPITFFLRWDRSISLARFRAFANARSVCAVTPLPALAGVGAPRRVLVRWRRVGLASFVRGGRR